MSPKILTGLLLFLGFMAMVEIGGDAVELYAPRYRPVTAPALTLPPAG